MKALHGRMVAFACALAAGVSAACSAPRADTSPIRFLPADSVIRLDVGTFGPCARDFDPNTRVASVYCPKVGSPEEREFLFINVYLAGIWADSADAELVAHTISESTQSGLIMEGAFSAPSRPTTTELTYFLVQTHVQPGASFGHVYLTALSPADEAVVAVLYGQRFDVPAEELRARERQWLADNLTTHFRQISRISLDSSWFGVLRSLAR